MATKTIILRPTSVTSDNETLVTLYPTDTTMANAHTLVNEEVADDDSTYITSGLGSNVNYHFTFTKPDDLKTLTGISFVVRHRMESSSTSHSVGYVMYVGNTNYKLATLTSNPTAYEDMTGTTDSSIVDVFNGSTTLDFYITQAVATGNNKSKPIRTTQIYVEVTYENNEASMMYFKQNDTWVSLGELSMYYKRNNKWNLLNDSQIDAYTNKNYLIGVIE